ncbi:Lrp/AsnC family transcriptional regulator [Sphingomonas lacusdianchii]|uniref:Lrp/AsnC family transcriptional regulator n=1 Tax=Sphingomonas lacusdianchii TaxID=2917992 RepID=UPI001F58F243|nr:Lrp/AsnC family transcriptional regulator [Sphingomonas sp. JXJ CY 53]
MRDLDRYDRELLHWLQRDALRTAEDLARDVALSPSAITRRVRRMREDGTIVADVSIVSDRVGAFLSALVDIQLDRHALPHIDALLRRLDATPQVQAILEVTGTFDLTLMVVVADMEEYNRFADAMLADDPVIRRYETRFVKKRRKWSAARPFD